MSNKLTKIATQEEKEAAKDFMVIATFDDYGKTFNELIEEILTVITSI